MLISKETASTDLQEQLRSWQYLLLAYYNAIAAKDMKGIERTQGDLDIHLRIMARAGIQMYVRGNSVNPRYKIMGLIWGNYSAEGNMPDFNK